MPLHLRIVTWNLHWRVGVTAERQGRLLSSLAPDIVLLQEVHPASHLILADTAGLDWIRCSLDLRKPLPAEGRARRLGCAIGGRGLPPATVHLLPDVPLPERLLIGRIPLPGQTLTLASYHAPPGVNWKEKKPQQAVAFAQWLSGAGGPTVLGADANTPEIDHPDFAQTRTHWHTGKRRLNGAPGDDKLFGPAKIHQLSDALRLWLGGRPEELAALRVERPTGPLIASHYTGKRDDMPGNPRRFDAIWVSSHFEVKEIDYLYEQSCEAGSDHAAVRADLVLKEHAAIV